jgi:hypothetical protein
MSETKSIESETPAAVAGAAPGSANFHVHDALGNWMIEDRQMGRMIAMSTRERDARFIAEALNAYSPNWPLTTHRTGH